MKHTKTYLTLALLGLLFACNEVGERYFSSITGNWRLVGINYERIDQATGRVDSTSNVVQNMGYFFFEDCGETTCQATYTSESGNACNLSARALAPVPKDDLAGSIFLIDRNSNDKCFYNALLAIDPDADAAITREVQLDGDEMRWVKDVRDLVVGDKVYRVKSVYTLKRP